MRESKREKFLKRAGAILLLAVMLFSVTACESKPKNVKSAVEELTAFDVSESDIDVTCVAELETGKVEVSGKAIIVNMSKNSCVAEIKYRLDGAEYSTLSTFFVTEDGIYINAKQAFAFIAEIYPQYASLGSYLNLSVDYVKITQKEIETYLKQYNLEDSFSNSGAPQNAATVMRNISYICMDMLRQISEKSDVQFASVEDGVLKMNIANENSAEIIKKISEFDFAQYNSSLSTEKKQYYNTQLRNAMTKLTDPVTTKGLASNISIMAQTVGKKGRKIADINFDSVSTNENGEKISVKMNITNRQVAVSSYVIPSEFSSLSELTARLSMGSSAK